MTEPMHSPTPWGLHLTSELQAARAALQLAKGE